MLRSRTKPICCQCWASQIRPHYPGFSDDPLDGFRHLRDDLVEYGKDFLIGSDDDFLRHIERSQRTRQRSGQRSLSSVRRCPRSSLKRETLGALCVLWLKPPLCSSHNECLPEQRQIYRIAHRLVSCVSRMQVIPGIVSRQKRLRMLRVLRDLVEINHAIEDAACPDPLVVSLPNLPRPAAMNSRWADMA